MRGATISVMFNKSGVEFLLTHLMRGATTPKARAHSDTEVSTHAPHARCDVTSPTVSDIADSFYSRTSCEVRL